MLPAAILMLAVIAYRVGFGIVGSSHLDWLHNFSPLAAVALCGAAFFPKRWAVAAPLAALLVSDLILNAHYHIAPLSWIMLPQYLALLAISE